MQSRADFKKIRSLWTDLSSWIKAGYILQPWHKTVSGISRNTLALQAQNRLKVVFASVLAACDYFLYPKLKTSLKGRKFFTTKKQWKLVKVCWLFITVGIALTSSCQIGRHHKIYTWTMDTLMTKFLLWQQIMKQAPFFFYYVNKIYIGRFLFEFLISIVLKVFQYFKEFAINALHTLLDKWQIFPSNVYHCTLICFHKFLWLSLATK